MKKIFCLFSLMLLLAVIVVADDESSEETTLTAEYQLDLINRLNHLHGEAPVPKSLEHLERPICGTPTAFEFFLNQDRLDARYKAMATQQNGRHPSLPHAFDSPGGHFKVHYEDDPSVSDAVYGSEPLIDTIPVGGDGIPDYVNKVAEIADSVWEYQINVLGFPAPPRDDFYPDGLDSLYDIYLVNIGSSYYGATFGEVAIDSQSATSVMELGSDYDFYPYNEYEGDPRDFNRRLDAIRVTMAHEFLHTIHFAMDYSEYEGTQNNPRLYWWEMSAVWMEEEMYDDINDYYGYLRSYFNAPWKSLRYFTFGTLHPYGAAVFPIFLEEKFGDSTMVRQIWEQCRDLGVGPDFPVAADNVIQSVSGGTHDFVDAFRDFSIWNIFTGSRYDKAPAGYGYSEREFYPGIPDSALFRIDDYPVIYTRDSVDYYFGTKRPEVLAANYVDFYNLSLVADSFSVRYFARNIIPVDWNVSMVGFPIDGVSDAVVYEYRHPRESPYKFYNVPGYRDLLHLVLIPTPISLSFTETNYNRNYDYTFTVLDSVNPGDTVYLFSAPYPNPVKPIGGDSEVNFKVAVPVFDQDPGDMEVIIYNVAGEKIRHLTHFDLSGVNLIMKWDLTNESGRDVASGVYMAYVRLTLSNGRGEEYQKYKLVVIR